MIDGLKDKNWFLLNLSRMKLIIFKGNIHLRYSPPKFLYSLLIANIDNPYQCF